MTSLYRITSLPKILNQDEKTQKEFDQRLRDLRFTEMGVDFEILLRLPKGKQEDFIKLCNDYKLDYILPDEELA